MVPRQEYAKRGPTEAMEAEIFEWIEEFGVFGDKGERARLEEARRIFPLKTFEDYLSNTTPESWIDQGQPARDDAAMP